MARHARIHSHGEMALIRCKWLLNPPKFANNRNNLYICRLFFAARKLVSSYVSSAASADLAKKALM
ncbi:MAG: hypothetical protein K0Q67_2854 [Cellvibrio sp.]|jgi:hypothetical protein|nr:hypothetical protein [Cellvibrio sp.]